LLSITMLSRRRWLVWKTAFSAAAGASLLLYGLVQIFLL
jgi:hypothetical protein